MCACNVVFCLKKNRDRPWISVYIFCNRGNTDCVYVCFVSCLCKGWFCGFALRKYENI